MLLQRHALTLALIFLMLPVTHAEACTTFLLPTSQGPLMGKSYDFDIDYGMAIFNKRGVAKRAIVMSPSEKPAQWVSTYASLTFNQFGRELPNGGMNETGLAIEIMWLNDTRYPDADKRATLNELQWIQYMLDTCSTVKEMIKKAPTVKISAGYAPVHYLACDRSSDCASFEYLNGTLVTASGKDMPVKALTNNTYEDSCAFLKEHKSFGGQREIGQSASSLDRFVRAASLTRNTLQHTPSDHEKAFAILDSVSQGDYSKWNIVYDLKSGRVWFRTLRQPGIKYVNISDFTGSCQSPVMVVDINIDQKGAAKDHFRPYTLEANERLIKQSFGHLIKHLPATSIEQLAAVPQQYPCTRHQ